MSRSSYTASERRGVIAIAVIALILIAGGAFLSYKQAQAEPAVEVPEVVAHPEMIDSLVVKEKEKKTKKSAKKKSSGSKKKTPKTYRRRNPIDETV